MATPARAAWAIFLASSSQFIAMPLGYSAAGSSQTFSGSLEQVLTGIFRRHNPARIRVLDARKGFLVFPSRTSAGLSRSNFLAFAIGLS